MKNLALKYPSLTTLFIFLIISISGSYLGISWGLLIMSRPCERVNSSDPCDAAAMAAGMIMNFSIVISIFVSGVISVSVFLILQRIANLRLKMK
jgi:hypothetical protein